ncbi:divalent-cation tolerance protein CutA [Catenuloplanes sp. NPDC051500]|uniref:divalent-cation tolerance protein CutA n=1 Tax=Catenuloplanes sp. NPDC051500 TaxID=3363959 RepID=UPI00378B7526
MEQTHLVTTTVDGRPAADSLARTAVTARLAACAQVGGPITSTYWWEGEIETSSEWVVHLKTTADRLDALIEHLRAAHPYDVPEIVAVPVTAGNPDYLSWVHASTHP